MIKQKGAGQKIFEQGGITISAYAVAQPFGVFVSAWLTSRGIPMGEPVATGALLGLLSVVGRWAIHLIQHRVLAK